MDGWKTSFFLETPISRAMLISGRVYLPNISELTPLWGLFWTWATQHFGLRLQPFLLRRQYCEGSNNTRKMVVNCRENLFLVTCRWLWYALVVFFVDENAYGWLLPFLLHFLRLWKDEHISHSHLFPHLCIEMTLVLRLKSVCFIRPSWQVRFIKEVPVFAVTATLFSFGLPLAFDHRVLVSMQQVVRSRVDDFFWVLKREFLQDFWIIKNGSPQKTTGPVLP